MTPTLARPVWVAADQCLSSTATGHCIVDQQDNYRSHHSDDHAVNVQARYTGCSEQIEQKSANESANNTEGYIQPEALALPINDLASDEPGN